MSNTKFTPGPWKFHPQSHLTLTDSSGRMSVASCNIRESNVGRDELEAEKLANAHLVAAAPSLYEALEDILEDALYCKENGPNSRFEAYIETCREALAKARGETDQGEL